MAVDEPVNAAGSADPPVNEDAGAPGDTATAKVDEQVSAAGPADAPVNNDDGAAGQKPPETEEDPMNNANPVSDAPAKEDNEDAGQPQVAPQIKEDNEEKPPYDEGFEKDKEATEATTEKATTDATGTSKEAAPTTDTPASSTEQTAEVSNATTAPEATSTVNAPPPQTNAPPPLTLPLEKDATKEPASPGTLARLQKQAELQEKALGKIEIEIHLETKCEEKEIVHSLTAVYGKVLEPHGVSELHLTISVSACKEAGTFVGVIEVAVPPEAQSVAALCEFLETSKDGIFAELKSDPKQYMLALYVRISKHEQAQPTSPSQNMALNRDKAFEVASETSKTLLERGPAVEAAKKAVKSTGERIGAIYAKVLKDVQSKAASGRLSYARVRVEQYFESTKKKDPLELEKEIKTTIAQALSGYGVLPEHITICVRSISKGSRSFALSDVRLLKAGSSAAGAIRLLELKDSLNETNFSLKYWQPARASIAWPVKALSQGLIDLCGKSVSDETTEQLAEVVGAAAKSMDKAWAAERLRDKEKVDEYMALSPKILHSEPFILQDVSTAAQLREDAEKANAVVLETISKASLSLVWSDDRSFANLPSDHPWFAHPSVTLLDPGVLAMEFIQDKIHAMEEKRNHEINILIPRHQHLLDISQVGLVYGTADGLLKGLQKIKDTFDVVTITDTFDHPAAPECGSLNVGVRIPLDNKRHHVGQIRLSLKGVHESAKLHKHELFEGLSKLLLAEGITLSDTVEKGMSERFFAGNGSCRKSFLLQWVIERLCRTQGTDVAVIQELQWQVKQAKESSEFEQLRDLLLHLQMRVGAVGLQEQVETEKSVDEAAKLVAKAVEKQVKAEEAAEFAKRRAADEAAFKAAEEAARKLEEEERLAAEAEAKAQAQKRAAEELAARKAATKKRFLELEAAEEEHLDAMRAFWKAEDEGSARVSVELPLRGTGIRADLLRLCQDAVAQTLARFYVLPENITGAVRGDGNGGWVAALEVHLVWPEASVMGIVAALEDALGDKNSPLRTHDELRVDPTNARMDTIWPLAGLAAGAKVKYKVVMPRDKVQELAQVVEDSAQMFLEAQCALWECEPQHLQKLWEMDSQVLGFTNAQITQNEDISLGELMIDAKESQKTLTEMLASAKSWELKPLSSKAEADEKEQPEEIVPGPAYEEYTLIAETSGEEVKHTGVASATCKVLTQPEVAAQATALERPHHRSPPYHAIVDVLKLDVVYSSASQLLAGLQEIQKCQAFSIATIDNTFHHPPALGHVGITIRVRIPVKEGRQHVATICLLLKELVELEQTRSPELKERITGVIEACAERSRIPPSLQQRQSLYLWILHLLDRTEGMELRDFEEQEKILMKLKEPQTAIPDLINKDRLASLRKWVAALKGRQAMRNERRSEDSKLRQEVAERAKRFKAPPPKEIPFGHHNPRLHQDLDDRLSNMWETWGSWPTRGQAGRTCDAVRLCRLAQPREDRSIPATHSGYKKSLPRNPDPSPPPHMSKTLVAFRPKSPKAPPASAFSGTARRTNPRKILGTLPRSDQTSWMHHLIPAELIRPEPTSPRGNASKQGPEQASSSYLT